MAVPGHQPRTAIFQASVADPERRCFRKADHVGANPTGSSTYSCQDSSVISSISPRDGEGPGANPGFLTIFKKSLLKNPLDPPNCEFAPLPYNLDRVFRLYATTLVRWLT